MTGRRATVLHAQERTAWVLVMLPWKSPLVAVGDHVSVEFRTQQVQWGLGQNDLVVRDEDGSLLLWVGDAAGAGGLRVPPEVEVDSAADACRASDGCGLLNRRGLRVAIGTGEVVVPYGQRAAVGGFTALHLGNDSAVSGGCSDWAPDHAGIAIIAGTPAELAARDRGDCGAGPCAASEFCALPDAAACDPTVAEASCRPAPTACEADCPGACGCDGRFYCNACRAAQAGVDIAEGDRSCMSAGCADDPVGASDGSPACYFAWSCFQRHYAIDCRGDSSVTRCTCSVDREATGAIALAPGLDCESPEAAAACGFPEGP